MALNYAYTKLTDNEYTFTSTGPKGQVKKVVTLEEISELGTGSFVYNVLLESEVDGVRLGDQERTNNGNPLRIIATVVEIIKDNLALHPERTMYIRGSNNQRSNLYQRRALQGLTGYVVLGQESPFHEFEFSDW